MIVIIRETHIICLALAKMNLHVAADSLLANIWIPTNPQAYPYA